MIYRVYSNKSVRYRLFMVCSFILSLPCEITPQEFKRSEFHWGLKMGHLGIDCQWYQWHGRVRPHSSTHEKIRLFWPKLKPRWWQNTIRLTIQARMPLMLLLLTMPGTMSGLFGENIWSANVSECACPGYSFRLCRWPKRRTKPDTVLHNPWSISQTHKT